MRKLYLLPVLTIAACTTPQVQAETTALTEECTSQLAARFRTADSIVVDTVTTIVRNDTAEVDGYVEARDRSGNTSRVRFYCQSVRDDNGDWKHTHAGLHPE